MAGSVSESLVMQNDNGKSLRPTIEHQQISATRVTRLVDTPYRIVEILEECVTGKFALRETVWDEHRLGPAAHVLQLWFRPHEIWALRDSLVKLLQTPEVEVPAAPVVADQTHDQPQNGKAKWPAA